MRMMRICSDTDLGLPKRRSSKSATWDWSCPTMSFRPATVSSVMGAIGDRGERRKQFRCDHEHGGGEVRVKDGETESEKQPPQMGTH